MSQVYQVIGRRECKRKARATEGPAKAGHYDCNRACNCRLFYLLPTSIVDVKPFVPECFHVCSAVVCVCETDLYCV
jgi:hypothetical protein